MRRDIKEKETKILFALSGNRCAFPGCPERLVYQEEGDENSVVLGFRAHIIGDSRRGPRGESELPDEQRAHHSNLVLLCGSHHKIVDDLPEIHTAPRMREMKRAHEARMLRLTSLPEDIVTSMAGQADGSREAILGELHQASLARCIVRWQSLGLPLAQAAELANDFSVATPVSFARPDGPDGALKRISILLGDFGVGKSLAMERRFQSLVRQAQADPAAAVPVWLDAKSVAGPLGGAIKDAAHGIGSVAAVGAEVFIDSVDEVGAARAEQILAEARTAAYSHPRIRVTLAGRPLAVLATEEAVPMPLLTDEEAERVIALAAGRPVEVRHAGWPEAVREAVRRPLFALIMGLYLADSRQNLSLSTGELLAYLVERALSRAQLDLAGSSEALKDLAVQCVEAGNGFVDRREAGSWRDLGPLLASRLVVESEGRLGFPIAVVMQWLAAQRLLEEPVLVSSMAQGTARLERWRYPLVIAIGTGNQRSVDEILTALVQAQPAFASQLITETLKKDYSNRSVALTSVTACGREIQGRMRAWANGLGPLGALIAPVDAEGHVRPLGIKDLGIKGFGGGFAAGWYHGEEDRPELTSLPETALMAGRDFPLVRHGAVGAHPAWAWRWTLAELQHRLQDRVKHHKLPAGRGPLLQEYVWQTAVALLGRGGFDLDPVSLSQLEPRLFTPDGEVKTFLVGSSVGGDFYDTRFLAAEFVRLKQEGQEALRYPWPGYDLPFHGGHIGHMYSPEQALRRAQAVYRAALAAYRQLVDQWFPAFKPFLLIGGDRAMRFTGWIVYNPEEHWTFSPFGMVHYFEHAPLGQSSHARIALVDDEGVVRGQIQQRNEQYHSATSEHERAAYNGYSSGELGVFDVVPVTEIVYAWLRDDLKRVQWIDHV